MIIIVGSTNQTKINAVKTVFPEADIHARTVDAEVSSQPKTDEETRQGAINRAIASQRISSNGFGVGLEGGVYQDKETWYLCSWGAWKGPEGPTFVAGGARIPIPTIISDGIQQGIELGEWMEQLTHHENIGQSLGTIGVLTNQYIDRTTMFVEIVKMLRGQWEFYLRYQL